MATLSSLFQQNCRQFGNSICIEVYQPSAEPAITNSLSYQQFYSALLLQAQQLQELFKLKKDDTIAILADNSLAYLILAFAAPLIGIRVLLISTKVLPDHLQHFLHSTNCKLLFVSKACQTLADTTACSTILLGESSAADKIYASSTATDFKLAEIDENACALILHTSGTTSTPRLVYLTHQNILSNQRAVAGSVGGFWNQQDSSLAFLPLFHGYTLLSQILRNLTIGARTVLLQQAQSPSAASLIQALQHTKVSFFCCVPWMLKLLHDQILSEQAKGSSTSLRVLQNLRFIITGGALLDHSTGNFLTANKVKILTFFGLTEAAGFVMHSSFDNQHWEHLQLIAGQGLHFTPDADNPQISELTLSATPMTGNPSATSKPEQLVYHTSDLFRTSPHGWRYLGRNDQIYNGPHGEKINPLRFETELEKHPMVLRVFVTGENLLFNAALVELNPDLQDSPATKQQVLDHIQNSINPGLEVPARIYTNDVIILAANEHIQTTPKGSVDRKAASNMLVSKLHNNSAGKPEQHNVAKLVHQQIRAYLQLPVDQSLAADIGLIELGFDSLMLLSLRNTLQQLLEVVIPLDEMLGFPRVDTLIKTLVELAPVTVTGASEQLTKSSLPHAGRGQWANIPLEQVIFHTAHYIFPFPTYNVSMSLLAPAAIDHEQVKSALRYLETKHEILRSVYQAEGTYRIEKHSFVDAALLGISNIEGSHDIFANDAAKTLIGTYLSGAFDLSNGPVYRYALFHITNADGLTRTLIYLGLHHAAGDFKGFNSLLSELMDFLVSDTCTAVAESDNYAALVSQPVTEDLQEYQACWHQLLTVMPELKEGLDFRAGHKQLFSFKDINLSQVADIFRKQNISLYNGVYAVYVVALSRHLANQSLENFLSATAVTSRITAEKEHLMGCFIHSPVLRFHLDSDQSMLDMMLEVQRITAGTFARNLQDPLAYLKEVVSNPANLVPFLSRNIFLYRSPDEIMAPTPGWNSYRNELFFESSDLGMYFDFCANPLDQTMEGYVLINLHYCDPALIQPILDDIRMLLLHITDSKDLKFKPLELLP